jgi:hypothetical protein
MDAVGAWVLDVRLSKQETCVMLNYFLPRDWWLLHLFSNPPMKFKSVKVEGIADMWVPMSDSLNNKCVLSRFFLPCDCWLLGFYFWTRP